MSKNTAVRRNADGRMDDRPILIVPDRADPERAGEARFRVDGQDVTVRFEGSHWSLLRCLAQGTCDIRGIRSSTGLRLMTIMNYVYHLRSHLPLVAGEETLVRQGRGDDLRYKLRGARLRR